MSVASCAQRLHNVQGWLRPALTASPVVPRAGKESRGVEGYRARLLPHMFSHKERHPLCLDAASAKAWAPGEVCANRSHRLVTGQRRDAPLSSSKQ